MLTALLLATTVLYRERLSQTPYSPHPFPSTEETVMAADELAELSGRSVHGSWDRDNPNSARNDDYLRRLIDLAESGHFEHASATFWVTGGSLSLASALHDVAPFLRITQSSLRYRDLADVGMVTPSALLHDEEMTADLADVFDAAKEAADEIETDLVERGFHKRVARDAALSVMPQCTEATLLVTGDMLSWRHVIESAHEADAPSDLYILGTEVFRQLQHVAPNSIQGVARERRLRLMLNTETEPQYSAA